MKIHSPRQAVVDPIQAIRIRESVLCLVPRDEWEVRAHQLALALVEACHFCAAELELVAITDRRAQKLAAT